ncbi:MAG TPA: DUF4282 domain-containing protein [Gemmataceae bacterium]|nr:DUF4282 domain-containing protein [Gemmataceae bacterium]
MDRADDEALFDGPFSMQRQMRADSPPRLQKNARHDDDDDDDDDDDRDRRSIKKKRRGSGGNSFVDFLLFRKMVGPWVLLILYWLVVVLCLLGGIAIIIFALIAVRQVPGLLTAGSILYGLAIMILGPIVYRVAFELAITIFRIYETLVEIRDKL